MYPLPLRPSDKRNSRRHRRHWGVSCPMLLGHQMAHLHWLRLIGGYD
ncbi:Uncharacterised protein [Vibrio cholerae]|nr:Uncharacterised protein [Vibrio cholerae]